MPARNQIAIVVGLMLLAALVQVVTVRRATVTGLDAVRFVRSAKTIDQYGLLAALRGQREQPLFPVSVWTVHRGMAWAVGDFRSSWALSAQLAAAAALVFSVVPVYFIARRMAGPAAAVWGAAVYCILPEVSRLGADGISDGLHLFFFCSALWMAIVYLTGRADADGSRCGNPLWLAAAGAASGLAVLVRVEGLILPAALILALVLFQFRADLRQPWRRIPVAVGLLGLGFCLIVGPYLAVVDSVVPKLAFSRVLGRYDPSAIGPTTAQLAVPAAAATWYLDNGSPMSFAKKEPTISLRRRGLLPAASMFVGELARAYGYFVGLLALLGLWRRSLKRSGRSDRFLLVYFVLFSGAAYHFAAGEGYVSARHLLPLVVVGIGSIGYGVDEVRRWLAGLLSRRSSQADAVRSARRVGWIATGAIVAVVTASCLIESAQPIHASRAGHRRAAAWLARDARMSGAVLDTRGWTGLYSGRTTFGYEEAQAAFSHAQLAYVVLEDRELQYASRRSQTLGRLLDVAAEPVTRFAGPRGRGYTGHAVVVYRWNAQRFSRWLDSQAAVEQARGT